MATIGPQTPDQVSPTQDPNYFHWAHSVTPIAPDESMKIAGEAIGKGLAGIGKVADKAIETHLDDAIHSQIDPVMDQTNLELASKINVLSKGTTADEAGNPVNVPDLLKKPQSERTPADIQNLATIANNIRQGKEHGVYDDTYYRMKMDSIAKDYRSRFPGFRDYIDEKIKGAEGSTANQLRVSQIQTLNDLLGQKDTQKNKVESFALTHSDLPGVKDKYFQWKSDPTPSNEQSLVGHIMDQRVFKTEQERAIQQVHVDEADQKRQRDNFTPQANKDISNITSNTWETTIPGMDPKSPYSTPRKAMDMAIKIQTGQIPSDAGIDPVQVIQAGKNSWQTQYDAYLNSTTKDGKHTVRDLIGEGAADKFMKEHLAIWDARIKAASEGNKMMADYAENILKVKKASGEIAVYNNPAYDSLTKMGIINRIVGQGPAGKALENFMASGELAPALKQLGADRAVSMATQSGQTLQKTITDTKAKLEGTGESPADAKKDLAKMTKYFVANSISILLDDRKDPELNSLQHQIADNVFSPDSGSVFNEFANDKYDNNNRLVPGKFSVFYDYGSPQMVQKMKQLGTEDARTFTKYKNTVENWAGRTLLPSALEEIKELKTSPYVDLHWDDATGNFISKDLPHAAVVQKFSKDQQGYQGLGDTGITNSVRWKAGLAIGRVNSVMDTLKNIAKAEGADLNVYVTTLLHQWGYDERPSGTLGRQMIETLKNAQTFEGRYESYRNQQKINEKP